MAKYVFISIFFMLIESRTGQSRSHHFKRENDTGKPPMLVKINTMDSECTLDKRFLSISIDAIEMKRKFQCARLNSLKVNRLASALSPAYIRVGGTPQDFAEFIDTDNNTYLQSKEEGNKAQCSPKFINWKEQRPFNVTSDVLQQIFEFAKRNSLDLIFGLNALHRNVDQSWDETNAKKIINFVEKNKFKAHWELGNEPKQKKFGKKTFVTQHLKDLHKLKRVTKGGRIFGPDTGQPKRRHLKYLRKYLTLKPPIDAVTYHQYWMHQSRATLDAYLNISYLNKLQTQMLQLRNLFHQTNTSKPLWLGETGSSSGGGAANLSDTFAAGFLYLGKLGLASQHCHTVVIRQSFYGGYYGMLDAYTRDPLPDYWSSLLFKKLVGLKTLNISTRNEETKYYAFCCKSKPNAIVVMYINFNIYSSVIFSFAGFEKNPIEQYILTSLNDNLLSKDVLLNGKLLRLGDEHRLPKLEGQEVYTQPLTVPKASYGFFVINQVKVSACTNSKSLNRREYTPTDQDPTIME